MSISKEAIEAAAEALEARSENDDWEWCLGDATAALTAAAPYIQAAALREAAADAAVEQPFLVVTWLRARAATIEGKTR